MGPWRPHKIRQFSPLLTSLFHKYLHRVFNILLYVVLESCDINFAGQVVYKPWSLLAVSSEALMPIIAILIPAADCELLLHHLVIGPVTVHLILHPTWRAREGTSSFYPKGWVIKNPKKILYNCYNALRIRFWLVEGVTKSRHAKTTSKTHLWRTTNG